MENQLLIDFANWLWDIDRLKVTTQLPPFENSGMMVELYLKAKMLNDQCEGKADRTSEKDLRVCELVDKEIVVELCESLNSCLKFLEETSTYCKSRTNITKLGESTLLKIINQSQETLKKAVSYA